MAVAEGMIAWAIRFGATSYVLNVDGNAAGASDQTFNEDGSNLSTTADYFMAGEGEDQDICRLLKNTIEGHSSGIKVNCYLNSSGYIQIDLVSGTSFAINWTAGTTTLDPELFGFGYVDTGAVTTVTAPNRPKGIWLPGFPITVDDKERDQIIGGVSMSISGKVRISDFGTAEKDRRLFWEMLAKENVRQDYAAIPQESFQHAWVNSIKKGYPFRYYPDDTLQAVTARKTYRTASLEDPMRRSSALNILWDVDLACKEDSSADYSASVYSLDCDAGRSATAPTVISGDTAWTMACWFYRDTTAAADSMIGQWAASERCFFWQVDASDNLYIRLADDLVSPATITVSTNAGSVYSASTWTHFACTFDAGTVKLYVNGKQMSTTTSGSPPSTMTSSTSALGIGQDGGGTGNDSNSLFDDLCFWSRALNPAEIKIVKEGLPTKVPDGLTRWWGFEREGIDHVAASRITPASTAATYSTTVRS